MKMVILGSVYILGGILFSLVSLLRLNQLDFHPLLLIIGVTLFLIGSIFGIAGILSDK